MLEFFQKLFTSDFMPHGFCYKWHPEILWLHLSSDALIALSYYLIPLGLFYLMWKRRDLAYEYYWIVLLFSIFIFSCGTTHLMQIWTLWHGTYRLEGVIKALTAISSFLTALLFLRIIPAALKLPSAVQLSDLNAALEARVNERTAELEAANLALEGMNATLRRANEDLNRFAYSASHDLQEPIRMVAIYTELLKKRIGQALDEKAQQYMGFVAAGAVRMEALVKGLLNYAQIGHEQPRDRVSVDANAVLEEVITMLGPQIQETTALITADSLPVVPVARVHLSQLLQNLLSNSLKYRHPDRPPVISLDAADEGSFWQFCVEDNGIGIEPEYREYVFGLFKRLHASHRFEGSGIGLSICERVVDLYGGRIWVESTKAEGTRFCFTLPKA
jgi:signal transduction histidine kinase